MSLWSLMDSVASAYRPAIGKGLLDGVTQDFNPADAGVTTLFSNRACSCQPPKAMVRLFYQQRDQECDFEIKFGEDPGDLVNCLLVVQRGRIGDTINLIALGTAEPQQMGQTWVWAVNCNRVRQPV